MGTELFPIVLIVTIVGIVVKIATGAYSGKEPWEDTLKEIKQKNMEEERNMQITNEGVEVEIGTRDLLLRALVEIGCQYTIDEDERICFAYQGEHLWAEAINDCPFVNVYDAFWESCELYNVDRIAHLKQAINSVNMVGTVIVLYTIADEDNTLWVHCKKNFLFIPQIPHIGDYLHSVFASLFQAHHALGAEMARLEGLK